MTAAREAALNYLAGHNVMTLATTGPAGVWAAAVFYVNDSFTLYFLSGPSSRHSRNVAADPGVAVTIQADYSDWATIKGIQLEGEAQRLSGQARNRAILLYGQKFPLVGQIEQAPPPIQQAFSKVAWYRVTPRRLYFVDNSRGFGHRDEIVL